MGRPIGSYSASALAGLILCHTLVLSGCGGGEPGGQEASAPALVDDPALISQGIPGLDRLQAPWFGDLDAMVERRIIRAAVVHSKTLFFLDGARPRGLTFDSLTLF
jgi:hypothetical protein